MLYRLIDLSADCCGDWGLRRCKTGKTAWGDSAERSVPDAEPASYSPLCTADQKTSRRPNDNDRTQLWRWRRWVLPKCSSASLCPPPLPRHLASRVAETASLRKKGTRRPRRSSTRRNSQCGCRVKKTLKGSPDPNPINRTKAKQDDRDA